MQIEYAAQIDPGRVRQNNEDAVGVEPTHSFAVLADGMGGYNAGEVASAMAVACVREGLAKWCASSSGAQAPAPRLAQAMAVCAQQANTDILRAASANPQYANMGTTLVVMGFRQDRVVLAHVGDSRAYRLRAHTLSQLTKDHSLLQEQVDAGLLTREQAAVAPGKNLLTRALGVEEGVQVDLTELPAQPGDLYLLCSDGLTDMLSDDQIAQVLSTPMPLARMAQTLIDQANALGGRDNIAVVLAGLVPPNAGSNWISKWMGLGR